MRKADEKVFDFDYYSENKPLRHRARHYGEVATEVSGNAKLYVHPNSRITLTGIKLKKPQDRQP